MSIDATTLHRAGSAPAPTTPQVGSVAVAVLPTGPNADVPAYDVVRW